MKKYKEVAFEVPNYVRPDETEEGEEFETLASFKQDKDGKLTIISIDGYPLNPEADTDEADLEEAEMEAEEEAYTGESSDSAAVAESEAGPNFLDLFVQKVDARKRKK